MSSAGLEILIVSSGKTDRADKRSVPQTALRTLTGALLLCAGCISLPARAADDDYQPRTMYGDLGILEMPSARMAPDGQISLTAAGRPDTQRYTLGFQVLPWLEGSFRYSHIKQYLATTSYYDRSFGLKIRLSQEDDFWPEVSLGIRDILGTGVYGEEYIVATKRIYDFEISGGLGWGRLSSNQTLSNPLGEIFPSFKTRSGASTNGTGSLDFGQYFHGPYLGGFAGIIWKTPIEGLDLLAEYSSDDYKSEQKGTFGFRTRSPFNVGVAYHLFDSVTLSAGYYYGTTYGLVLTLFTDPTKPLAPIRVGPDVPAPVIRSDLQQMQALEDFVYRKETGSAAANEYRPSNAILSQKMGARDVEFVGKTLFVDVKFTSSATTQCDRYSRIAASLGERADTIAMSDLEDGSGQVKFCAVRRQASPATVVLADSLSDADGVAEQVDISPTVDDRSVKIETIKTAIAAQNIEVESISMGDSKVSVYYRNMQYRSEAEAAGRIARVLMAQAPPNIEIFDLISIVSGVPMREFRLSRTALERVPATRGDADELADAIDLEMPDLRLPAWEAGRDASYPRFSWGISPALRESLFDPSSPLTAQVSAAVSAALEVTPGWTLEGSFDANIWNNFNLNAPSASALPHVRSDIAQYFKHGEYGFSALDTSYRARIADDVFVEAKAGYLEDMFAGAGGQILWRPDRSRFAFGADIYEVWQRNFDRLFGAQKYHVLTGHVSVYYQSPWYGLNLQVHAGRYLAGDYGATFELTRRFSTGVEIGFFATFTNVPFKEFGEGSFDKGLIVRIPFEWALPFFTQSSYDLDLRSLTRDGGQRLMGDDSLFDETRSTGYSEVWDHLDDITNP